MLKVLILSTFDFQGGAARAAFRLYSALRKFNVEAFMAVRKKSDDNQHIIGVNKSIPSQTLAELKYLYEKMPLIRYKNREHVIFSTAIAGDNVLETIRKVKPDIVHLHWINRGYIKLTDLARIDVPVVWSMHDMWPFTGGCHYNMECENYLTKCNTCPILKSTKSGDVSNSLFRKKELIYGRKNIHFIGLSKWLADTAKKSALLKDKQVYNLPNPIDTSVYKPLSKELARKIWNFHPTKPLIIFGAMDATGEKRKGFLPLLAALKSMDLSNYQIKVIGSTRANASLDFNCDIQYLGNIYDDISMSTLYATADVAIVPSLQENLSNVIMESLSCGVPVVAFNIGGNSDMVQHKINGYLAIPFDSADMAAGIKWVISESESGNTLSQNARDFVLQHFDEKIVAEQYLHLYNQILNAN